MINFYSRVLQAQFSQKSFQRFGILKKWAISGDIRVHFFKHRTYNVPFLFTVRLFRQTPWSCRSEDKLPDSETELQSKQNRNINTLHTEWILCLLYNVQYYSTECAQSIMLSLLSVQCAQCITITVYNVLGAYCPLIVLKCITHIVYCI